MNLLLATVSSAASHFLLLSETMASHLLCFPKSASEVSCETGTPDSVKSTVHLHGNLWFEEPGAGGGEFLFLMTELSLPPPAEEDWQGGGPGPRKTALLECPSFLLFCHKVPRIIFQF